MKDTPRLAYPMPCPRCRRIIDARARLCPHCGVDTDATLAPARAIAPLVAVALLLAVSVAAHAGIFWYAVLGGAMLGMVARTMAARRQRG